MWDWLVSIYSEPRFLWFPIATSMVSMASFLLFALPLTWLAIKNPAWAQPYKIQNRKVRSATVIGPSLKSWLINNAWLTLLVVLSWPLIRLSGIHMGELPAWYMIAGQLLLFIYVDDFLYYWMHRFFHSNAFCWRHIHAKHHRILAPWAISGHYMHPIEFIATGSLMLLGPAILGVHVVVLWAWVVIRQWEASEGHCGYDLPFSPTRWLPGCDGAVHHDQHHAKVRGNYGGFLAWVDRLLGTLVAHYDGTRHRNK